MASNTLHPYLPDESWFRFNPLGIHGVPHTTRVLLLADRLAGMIAAPGAIRGEELRWAATVHDVGRVDDGVDPGHGGRSAYWVRAKLADVRPASAAINLRFVAELCRWHERQDQEIERLSLELLILKDADALDRARLGDLDPRRLRLARSHDLIDEAMRLERATNSYGSISAVDVLVVAQRLGLFTS